MARSSAAYQGVAVDIRGVPEVQKMLAALDAPTAKKMLQKATAAGGPPVKDALIAAAPYPGLKRSVWARTAKRQRPAYVIGHHKKKDSFYWHMIVGGTQDHGPRKAPWLAFWSHGRYYVLKRVRGIKPNPFVARAYTRSQHAAERAIGDYVGKYLDSL